MDADVLRLLLFIAGIALIIGIYVWDKKKKSGLRIHAIRKLKQVMPQTSKHSEPEQRLEPVWQERRTEQTADQPQQSADDDVLDQLEALVRKEVPAATRPVPEQTSFSFSADPGEGAQPSREIPSKILQINLLSRQGRLRGEDIVRAAEKVALTPGDMSILHRHDRQGALFSMASMVEPGTFPFDEMSGFDTPGLVLFARLPSFKDGLVVFDEMLAAANALAVELGGELQDETHSDLSRQTIEHIREEIREYNRQLRLAKSRP